MNFLQLCQRVRQEAAITGSGPATVADRTGMEKKVVDWVVQAWLEIQGAREGWNFLQKEKTFNLTIGQDAYTASAAGISNLDEWVEGSARLYDPSIGVSDEVWLPHKEWSKWRPTYRLGSQTANRPVVTSISPSNQFVFGPKPDAAYTVTVDYLGLPVTLADDEDVPAISSNLHMIIVHKALMYYGTHEDAPEVLQGATYHYGILMSAMERKYLPEISIGAEAIGE